MNDKQEFLDELKALLKKHNVLIWVGCSPCSDLHGVNDEHIQFIDTKRNEIFFRVDGWGVDYSDLEEDKSDTEYGGC